MNKLRGILLGTLIWIVYKILSATWRVTLYEPPEMQSLLSKRTPIILSHFHGDEIVLLSLITQYRIATIASTSKDGEIMNAILWFMRVKTSRGSSTRGGASALRGLIRLCQQGYNCGFAVDGPKGPIYEIKPGVFEASRLLNAPIFAAGVTVGRAWHFPKSWNKTFLPKPFSQVQISWLGPMGPIDKSFDPRSSDLAKALQNQLFDARRHSANLIATTASES